MRKIQDFESPFVSLRSANKYEKHRILLRKSWVFHGFNKSSNCWVVSIWCVFLLAEQTASKKTGYPKKSTVVDFRKPLPAEFEKNTLKKVLGLINNINSSKAPISPWQLLGTRLISARWFNFSPFLSMNRMECLPVHNPLSDSQSSSSKVFRHFSFLQPQARIRSSLKIACR